MNKENIKKAFPLRGFEDGIINTENCYWTQNIAEGLECSQDGLFDEFGYAINECPLKGKCEKYKEAKNIWM